jgi:hypothetical protein
VAILPFALAALSQWMEIPALPGGLGHYVGLAYGALVLSFLGGVRWGAAIGDARAAELTLSAFPVLAGWLALLLPAILGVSLLIAGFLTQALWDAIAVERGRLPRWYGRFCAALTAGAVLALLALLARLII